MKWNTATLAAISLFSFSVFITAREEIRHDAKILQNQEEIIDWANEHLPHEGVLTEEKGGFVYVKVDDDYIFQLYPLLHNPQYAKPPYFRRPDSPGAHISVFYVDERDHTGKIKEIGQKYTFSITGLAAVPPKYHEYIVLKVSSPELENLRCRYGLSPLLKGHEFHITIAKKKKKESRQ